MKFKEQFPSLKDKKLKSPNIRGKDYPIVYTKDIQKYCLDKQEVGDIIENNGCLFHSIADKEKFKQLLGFNSQFS